MDEFQRASVEIIVVHRALRQSPADELLRQVQGMMAEDARATILERHRRGTLHAARAGAVNVRRGVPDGYR